MRDLRTPTIVPLLLLVFSACAQESPLPAAPETADEGGALLTGKADGADLPAYAALPAGADLEAPLEVLFAPDDPVTTIELTLIEEIIARRAADDGVYVEGDNPYRIRYAVYNLRNPDVVARLADAHDAGVDVQVLIEEHQLDPAKTWNTADETLIARGFEFAPSHLGLSADERRTLDLIGIEDSGLMHLKARRFEAPGYEALLSGSMNPGDNAVFNEETLHLIRDPALIARYRQAYDDVLEDRGLTNTWDADAPLNVLFTPVGSGPRASTKVLEWVAAEDEQILLMVFSLRDISAPGVSGSLVEILADKAAAGVPVVVITDRKQSDGVDANGNPMYWNDGTEDRLRTAGVRVYEATNRATEFTAMHHKVAVLGKTDLRVISDAANWTKAGLGSRTKKAKNVESVLFIDSAAHDGGRIGRRYLSQFLRVLERYAWQSAERDGEPPFETVAAALAGAPDWPTQPVWFSARAFTEWGERAAIVGDAEPLGDWARAHGGVSLDTDGETYPMWFASAPARLPVGLDFAYKLVIQNDAGEVLRWESGDNRAARAAPAVLLSDPVLGLHAQWR